MKSIPYVKMHVIAALAFCLCLLPFFTNAVQANDITQPVRQAINTNFPGAVIKETRQVSLDGKQVMEVELKAQDGTGYEVIISNSGEILSIVKENGLPLIGGELTLGLALRAEKEIYRGVDTEYRPVPFLRYDNERLNIVAYDSVDAAFRFYKTDRFSIALKGSLELNEGYNPDDSDYLKGMDELDNLFSAGLEFEWNYAGFFANLDILQDISGEHDGQQVELALFYPCEAAGFRFRPTLSASWKSDKTVDYFYGVSQKEARVNRPIYSPRSSYELEAELLIQRPIFGNFSIIGIIEVTRYGSAITDSPIVEREYSIEGAIGIAYTF